MIVAVVVSFLLVSMFHILCGEIFPIATCMLNCLIIFNLKLKLIQKYNFILCYYIPYTQLSICIFGTQTFQHENFLNWILSRVLVVQFGVITEFLYDKTVHVANEHAYMNPYNGCVMSSRHTKNFRHSDKHTMEMAKNYFW